MAVQPMQPEKTTRLWEQVLALVQDRVGSPQTFDTWFQPIHPLHLGPQSVELEVPNPFFVDWIHEHHLHLLRQCLAEVLGQTPAVRLVPRDALPLPESERQRQRSPQGVSTSAPSAPAVEGPFNPRHTFETFVVGSSNHFTHAACIAVARNLGNAYNPLFVFGGSGLGKTHLLHAIGQEVRHTKPEARICYVSAESFTNEIIYAIQHARTLAFRNKYRNMDVLLIDDIQFLAGKESTQEEFFYTFNALRDAHKQIVVTADKPPKDIPMLEQRLISRFNHGLVTHIKHPDLETRIAILRNRCDLEFKGDEKTSIPDDVLLLIADRISDNIRDLEGCLVRLLALASLLKRDINVELAEEVLSDYVNPEPDHLTPERVIAAVEEKFGVKAEALCGKRRTRNVALPRQVAMYLLRQVTDLSLVEIGRVFGGRDHTTVLYACEKVGALIAADFAFADKVNGMISTLASG